MEGVEGREAARRQDHHPGRDRFHLELRRASRAGGGPHRAIRARGGSAEHHRRGRLRLRHLRRPAAGRLQDRVDEARLARRGRAARFEGTMVSLRARGCGENHVADTAPGPDRGGSAMRRADGERAAAQPDFPDGPGKQTFFNLCGACHDINRVRAGYTPEGWHTVMRMMLNFDVPVPKNEVEPLTQYLIKNFPERPRPAAVVIPGPVEAAIKLWQVPTPGSRPHDPLATRDGAIWYTGQLSDKLGRLDPKSGEIKEYPLKTPQTGPHGLAEDKDGNIWFTGNHLSLIGKLDPKTGNVTEYRMPDPKAKDPHTIAIDGSGIVWFTAQNANMVGRIDPKTGEVRLVTSPTPNSRPYGLVINSKGIPVFVEFGVNKIATIDPNTMAIKE